MHAKLQLVLRRCLWLLLAWLMLRGVVDIISPPQPPPPVTVAPPAPPAVDSEEARAFAALFAREYLTWDAGFNQGERQARLAPFLPGYLDARGGLNLTDATGSQRVVDARIWELRAITDQTARVTILADVVTIAPAGTPDHATGDALGTATVPVTAGGRPRRLALSVPLSLAGPGFVVYDYPAFVPLPSSGALDEYPEAGGQAVSTPAAVQELLAGFFRAYAEGSRIEVSYFLVPDTRLVGLGGVFQFRELGAVELRTAGDAFDARVEVALADPAVGSIYRQRYLVRLVQRDRWYIQHIAQEGASVQ
ncbi:MAG TPA: conjugal transfer protein [Symbiobacteriaceae bacterium]|nr:conjugal transfer protein [Symbiobacteriaceae bacterium]